MKLLEISLQNVGGAPDGTYSFAPAGKPEALTLITGGPASGKASLLAAIAAAKELVGSYGPTPDAAAILRRGAVAGAISATWLLSEEEAAGARVSSATLVTEIPLGAEPPRLFDPGVRALFSTYSTKPDEGKLELFPANRRISLGRTARRDPSELTAGRLRPSRAPGKYADVRQEIVEIAARDAAEAAQKLAEQGMVARWEQPDSLAPIRRSLTALAPWLWLERVSLRGPSPEVLFRRSDGLEIELADLSESEQQALLFATVFERLGLSRSIVLVERPELFLHPGEHVRFARALEGLGVDNQILAATTSAELLAAVDPRRVVHVGKKG